MSVLRIATAGGRRRVKVIHRVVGIRMSVPATFPRAIRVFLLIVNVEVVISIPTNLKPSRYLARIVLIRQFDAEIQVSLLDEFRVLEHLAPDESGT
ncbi:hypothetical protein EFA46_015305 (plasmid) [Halarchaeum sp. CBA1220]|nr:hypothetical protein EFA46_015305 [Halarchaeum sp. CBA1220]